MAKIKISLAGSEITLEFSDTEDLKEQLEKIDFKRIEELLGGKRQSVPGTVKPDEACHERTPENVKELGTVDLLRISGGGQDAVKLAVFLAASGLGRDEIRKITGITILSS